MKNEIYGPYTSAWAELKEKAILLETTSISSMFEDSSERSEQFSQEAVGIFLDFSRQHFSREIFLTLLSLADQTHVKAGIQRMFSGEHINNTEDRAAMHIALRQPADSPLFVNHKNIMPEVEIEREKIKLLVDKLQTGQLNGYTGKPITDVINVGVGGSYLGPLMTTDALTEYRSSKLNLHFVSDAGGIELSDVLGQVEADTTLFIICSKSFKTPETLLNAEFSRDWLYQEGGHLAVKTQFIAISSNRKAMDEFGVAIDKQLLLWDWVGGRYSIWSGMGLALALTIGWDNFEEFLAGAHEMDKHFLEAPIETNMPILLALIGIWNCNFLGIGNHAVLPYYHRLRFLPAYFQQLEMESNGKSIRRNGDPVQCGTCPIIWGELGSNAQHSFYQLLHQGTERVSADFFLPVFTESKLKEQHDFLASNCLAQSWALAEGSSDSKDCSPYQHCVGNRPSSLVLFERLDPATLGKLIALYEHKVYVQGLIWDVNSFDQWGVQLGKDLVSSVEKKILNDGEVRPALKAAIAKFRNWID